MNVPRHSHLRAAAPGMVGGGVCCCLIAFVIVRALLTGAAPGRGVPILLAEEPGRYWFLLGFLSVGFLTLAIALVAAFLRARKLDQLQAIIDAEPDQEQDPA